MVARRKAPRRRAKKSFSISAIELGTALSLSQSVGLPTALKSAMAGNLEGALSGISSSALSNKNKIVGSLGAAFVGKMLAKSFTSGTLAKLGPVRIRA
jgi:hypothetical protein|tara:strand:- start:163 stop:456 length:294 start_codon:yes stop_codon:yes gene_type:complete